jgi:hypothetical protein
MRRKRRQRRNLTVAARGVSRNNSTKEELNLLGRTDGRFFELSRHACLESRVFVEDCAESILVVAKPEAILFGEQLDLNFAALAILRPHTI